MQVARDIIQQTEKSWGRLLALLRRTIDVGRDVVDQAHASAASWGTLQRLALFFLARATHNIQAIETLLWAGFSLEAASLLRTQVELAVDFAWISKEQTEERMELYSNYVLVLNHRRLETMARVFGPTDRDVEGRSFDAFSPHAPPGVSNAAEMMAYMENRYKEVVGSYKNPNQWAPINIRDRAKAVERLDDYDLIHREGSIASHSNAGTLAPLAVIDQSGVVSITGDPVALGDPIRICFAQKLYRRIVSDAVTTMGLDCPKELVTIDDEFDREFAQHAPAK